MSREWEGGKGDRFRGDINKYRDGWERIFGNKDEEETPQTKDSESGDEGPPRKDASGDS